jgi:hypothetical protein
MEKENQNEAIIKDLELQWKDHFHMRDQTWKTLTNSTLFFLGLVGLEIKGVGDFVMIPAYLTLVLISFVGYKIASHHRIRQEQKHAIITRYEKLLKLYDIKKDIIEQTDTDRSFLGRTYTAKFIIYLQIGICVVGVFLLLRRIFFA